MTDRRSKAQIVEANQALRKKLTAERDLVRRTDLRADKAVQSAERYRHEAGLWFASTENARRALRDLLAALDDDSPMRGRALRVAIDEARAEARRL